MPSSPFGAKRVHSRPQRRALVVDKVFKTTRSSVASISCVARNQMCIHVAADELAQLASSCATRPSEASQKIFSPRLPASLQSSVACTFRGATAAFARGVDFPLVGRRFDGRRARWPEACLNNLPRQSWLGRFPEKKPVAKNTQRQPQHGVRQRPCRSMLVWVVRCNSTQRPTRNTSTAAAVHAREHGTSGVWRWFHRRGGTRQSSCLLGHQGFVTMARTLKIKKFQKK